jgi:Common central domain of tyrosinase/Polyphenol oxidase middle domain
MALGTATVGANSAVSQVFELPPHIRDIIFNGFCSGRPKLRSNVHALLTSNSSDPTVDAYRRALKVMRTLSANDPHSLEFQADIHGTSKPPNSWPPNAPFSTCQHNFNFLSWHRMYLYFFERIVRSISGFDDFALPYWDYGQSSQRALPQVFRDTMHGADPNPLFDGSRNGTINGGGNLPASAVDAQTALDEIDYANFQSILNGTPHGAVHVTVGGNMGGFNTAGRDPIFWLHHCNIDRLWEKWLSQGGRVNPTGNSGWMNTEFFFYDECRRRVKLTGAQILFTVSQLGYQYQDPQTCIPIVLVEAGPKAFLLRAAKPRRFLVAQKTMLEDKPLRVSLDKPDDQRAEFLVKLASDGIDALRNDETRLNLVFEGLHAMKPVDGYYEVYLNLPDENKPDPQGPHYAGNINFFGRDMETMRSQKGMEHLPAKLNVTNLFIGLAERKILEGGRLDLTFVPVNADTEAGKDAKIAGDAMPSVDAVFLEVESSLEKQ